MNISDVDSEHMMIRVEHGNGGKDRHAMLPPQLRDLLRNWYRLARPRGLAVPRAGGRMAIADWARSVSVRHALLRRTWATLIYWKTGNLRDVQLLLGHTKIESTVHYLGIEVDDALAIAQHVEV